MLKFNRFSLWLYLQITIDVKVQGVEGRDTPAAEAKKVGATWVVFDK
jgi:hypothetical protein